MSHKTTVKTLISDRIALVSALGSLDTKVKTATEDSVKCSTVSFKRKKDGVFQATLGDRGRKTHTSKWFKKLNQQYTYHKLVNELDDMGYEVGQVTTKNGRISFEANSIYGGQSEAR